MQNRKRNRHDYSVSLCIAFMLVFGVMFAACVEEQQIAEQLQETPDETAVALPGLPEYVAGYESWLKLNSEPIPPVPGGDPHNGTKNVYVNKDRETIAPNGKQKFPYPDGSIVVKEATRPGKDYIGLIAIMRKVEGSNPAHNDWEFIEYTRGEQDADFTELASGRLCWNCHSGVKDIDYVFTKLD